MWLIILVIGGVGLYYLFHKSFYHFRVIEKGRCYSSGVLSVSFHRRLALRYICWRYQINTIVNLRSIPEREEGDWYNHEQTFCRQRGIEFVDIPMMGETPPTPEQVQEFVRLLADSKRVFLIHCEAGAIRTNMILAIYLKQRFKADNLSILNNLDFFGHDFNKPYRVQVKEFILNYNA